MIVFSLNSQLEWLKPNPGESAKKLGVCSALLLEVKLQLAVTLGSLLHCINACINVLKHLS